MAKKQPTLKRAVKNTKTKVAKAGRRTKLSDEAILDAFAQMSTVITNLSEQIRQLTEESSDVESEPEVQETVRRADGKIITVNKGKAQVQAQTTPVKEVVDNIKARYELWAFDEYMQGSIVTSGPKLDKILSAAKSYVTSANVDNALAAGELDRSWEAYYPEVFVAGQPTSDVIYAGNKRDGKHYVYVRGEDKWELRRPDSSVEFRFFLGTTSNGRTKNEWYAKDQRGKTITSLEDINLERKTVLFVKVI